MTSKKNLGQHNSKLFAGLLAAAFAMNGMANLANSQVIAWSADDGGGAGSGMGDFFDPNNWATGVVPIGNNKAPKIDGGGTAIITVAGTGAGVDTEALIAGDAGGSSGTYRMDSGYMVIYDAAGSVLGNNAGASGTLIMNGGTLDFGDVPGNGAGGAGGGLGISNAPGSTGRVELHNDAVLRSLDGWSLGAAGGDLAHGTPGGPSSTIVMDGTSQASLAGGMINRGAVNVALSGDAQLTLGNSKGPADLTGAYGIENGLFNMGAVHGSKADLVIEDNAIFNLSGIYNQKARATITVRDNGEFNIFNTSTGGTETDFKMQNYLGRENFNANDPDQMTSTIITLEGFGKFTVDSNPNTFAAPSQMPFPDGHPDLISTAGLILSSGDDEPLHSGDDRNDNYQGGLTVIDVKDSAEFSVVQGLWMTAGTHANASSTLKVTGPDATVTLGDLIMAEIIDQTLGAGGVTFGDPLYKTRSGTAELHSVITGSSHSTIQVTDNARIGNGELIVELSNYSPVAGDSYTLIATDNSSGVNGEFKTVDLSLAPLDSGLGWDLDYNADSVVLSVIEFSPADFNEDGFVDGDDLAAWEANLGLTGTATKMLGDANGDMAVNGSDFLAWQREFTGSAPQAENSSAVPEPSSLLLTLAAALSGWLRRKRSV